MTDSPNPIGRPSKYDPAYCELVIAKQSEGWSLYEVAAHLRVARATIDNWADAHPEFLNALTLAGAAHQAWWEKEAREALHDREFNAPVWKKSVEARFRHDYTERRENKTELAVDGSVAALIERIDRDGRRVHDRD